LFTTNKKDYAMQTNSEKERNSNFIEEKFNKIGLEKLSRESEFSKRN
jgi:hypothetical protein